MRGLRRAPYIDEIIVWVSCETICGYPQPRCHQPRVELGPRQGPQRHAALLMDALCNGRLCGGWVTRGLPCCWAHVLPIVVAVDHPPHAAHADVPADLLHWLRCCGLVTRNSTRRRRWGGADAGRAQGSRLIAYLTASVQQLVSKLVSNGSFPPSTHSEPHGQCSRCTRLHVRMLQSPTLVRQPPPKRHNPHHCTVPNTLFLPGRSVRPRLTSYRISRIPTPRVASGPRLAAGLSTPGIHPSAHPVQLMSTN